MTGNDYQKLAMRTNDGECTNRLQSFLELENSSVNVGDLINGIMGLNGEAGECVECIKKAVFHNYPLNIDEFARELGDVMWYVAMCCNAIDVSLDDIMQGNIDKLKERYPEGFSTAARDRAKLKELNE